MHTLGTANLSVACSFLSFSFFLLFSFFLSFLQPERIDPPDPTKPDYDIRADVWSLGISLVSLSFQSVPLVVIFTSMTLKDSCKIRTEHADPFTLKQLFECAAVMHEVMQR